jgi:hypothetical protein
MSWPLSAPKPPVPTSVPNRIPSESNTHPKVSPCATKVEGVSLPSCRRPSAEKSPQPGFGRGCPLSSPSTKRPLPSGRGQIMPLTSRPPALARSISTSWRSSGWSMESTSTRRRRFPSVEYRSCWGSGPLAQARGARITRAATRPGDDLQVSGARRAGLGEGTRMEPPLVARLSYCKRRTDGRRTELRASLRILGQPGPSKH